MLNLLHICIVFFTECYSVILKRNNVDEFKSVVKYNSILIASVLVYIIANNLLNTEIQKLNDIKL